MPWPGRTDDYNPFLDSETYKLAGLSLANAPFELFSLPFSAGASLAAGLTGSRPPGDAYYSANDAWMRNFTPFGSYLQDSPFASPDRGYWEDKKDAERQAWRERNGLSPHPMQQ